MSPHYLVDTNIILWAWHEPARLSRKQRELLNSSDAEFNVSIATIWEMSIKAALGKLETVEDVTTALISTGYVILPIEPAHAQAVRHLPLHHHDPFDRMLIVQAQSEDLTIITADQQFSRYEVRLA